MLSQILFNVLSTDNWVQVQVKFFDSLIHLFALQLSNYDLSGHNFRLGYAKFPRSQFSLFVSSILSVILLLYLNS